MTRNLNYDAKQFAGLEMISPQHDDMCGQIAKLVNQVRDFKLTPFNFMDNLSNLLSKRYGLNFVINIVEAPVDVIDFWTYENKYIANNIIGKSGVTKIVSKNETLIANIDLKKAYISGNISEVVVFICTTVGAVMGQNDDGEFILTDREFAAAILHEVGHGFNYIDYMINTVKIAATIYTRTEELMEADKPTRIKLINRDPKLKKLSDQTKKDLIEANKKDNLEIVILKGSMEKLNNQMNMDYYSDRSNEQLADIFALRNGAGDAIGTSLAKFTYEDTLFEKWVIDITSVLLTCGISIVACMAFSQFMFKTGSEYDSTTERILTAKREIINQLKVVKDKKLRTHLLDTIQTYDTLYNQLKNPPKGLYYYITYLASSSYRKNIKQEKTMKEIEEMVDNDLYVLGNKLKG